MYNCNWENLGKCSRPEVSFASETNSLLHLVSITTAQQTNYFTAKIVSTRQFINDTKSLIVGIRSDSYTLNETSVSFYMHPNLTIENISPSTISGIITEFTDCGTCFYRLYQMVNRQSNSLILKNEGFVYKVNHFIFVSLLISILKVCIFLGSMFKYSIVFVYVPTVCYVDRRYILNATIQTNRIDCKTIESISSFYFGVSYR